MASDIRLRLGRTVRRLRRKKGLTQQEFSELVNVDYKYVQLLEGKRPSYPQLNTLEKLAKALGMPLSRLIREVEKG